MKKTIQFVAVTLILLAGGVLTGMAQNSNVVSPEFGNDVDKYSKEWNNLSYSNM